MSGATDTVIERELVALLRDIPRCAEWSDTKAAEAAALVKSANENQLARAATLYFLGYARSAYRAKLAATCGILPT